MQNFRHLTLRLTSLALATTATLGLAVAQTTSPVVPREPHVNPQIEAAAKPYRTDSHRAKESLAMFESLNSTTPDDPSVESWLGFLYIQTGSPEKAIAPLERAAAKQPENLEVQINLGNAYFFSSSPQYEKALASYAKVSAARPKMSEPHYNSGVIYIQRRDYPNAIRELKTAESLETNAANKPFIENNLGFAYEKSKDIDDAAAKFREASDAAPTNRLFARNAGLAILKVKPLATDRTPYLKDAKVYLERADQNDPAVALALANIETKVSPFDLPKARALCDTAEKNLADPRYAKDRETYWFNIGAIRRVAGDTPGAIRAYNQALQLDPRDVEALKNLGLIHLQLAQPTSETKAGNVKEYSEAETAFDKLTGLVPNSFDAWYYLAASATGARDSEKAIAAYREAVKLGGSAKSNQTDQLIRTHLGLAEALYGSNDGAGAMSEYRQVLQMDKNNAPAFNGLGLIYIDRKQWAQAEDVLRLAIKADRTYVPAYNNIAIVLDHLFRRKEAIAELEAALRLDPQNPDLIANLQKLKGA